MKKILAFILVFTMMFSFAACKSEKTNGNDEEDTKKIADAIKDEIDEAEEIKSFSKEAVERYLKKVLGMKLSDIEPDWDWKLASDYSAYADSPSSSSGHAVIEFTKINGEVTEEEYNAYFSKVFDATAEVSQDGYNVIGYEFCGEGEDALAKTTLDDAMKGFLKGWGFRYNGKMMVVYVSKEYDSDKDSELGKLFYYDAAKVDIAFGLQKSFDESLDEAESYIAENEDEIKDALENYFK